MDLGRRELKAAVCQPPLVLVLCPLLLEGAPGGHWRGVIAALLLAKAPSPSPIASTGVVACAWMRGG